MGSVRNGSFIRSYVMKVTRVSPVEHRMFPIFYCEENGTFPFYIRPERKMEAISREQHEADFKSFVDHIYERRPKGFAVTCDCDNFGYEKPEVAKANHKRMFSKAQLLKWADRTSNPFEEKEYSLDGEFYYLFRRDDKKPVTVESAKAYYHIHCTSVDQIASGNATYYTEELIRKDNIYTNGEGVFFLEDYSKPCIFFNQKEIAEKFAAQVNDGNFDELRKLSNDAWSAIKAHHAAAKRAEDEAKEAERQRCIKAREAKEAERLSRVDKDSLVLDKNSIIFGNKYYTIINGNVVFFMVAGTHDGCTVGVYQEWSGSIYNEDLNAVMKMFLIDDQIQVFATSQDAHDYQKLS